MTQLDALGWLATAIFLASYSCRTQRALRLTQAGAALLWAAYGVMLHALPVIVANLLVAAVAAYSSFPRKVSVKPSARPDLSRIS